MNKKTKIAIGVAVAAVGILGIAEFGGAYYFQNHYTPKTFINGIDVTGHTISSARELMDEHIGSYSLSITGDSTTDVLSAADIDFAYDYKKNNIMEKALTDQKPLEWAADLFGSGRQYTLETTYHAKKLQNAASKMHCMKPKKKIASENAAVTYKNGAFEAVPEVYGNELQEDTFVNTLAEQLSAGNTEYTIDCYIQPELKADSKAFQNQLEKLNKAANADITLKRDDISVSLSKDDIAGMLLLDEKHHAAVDTEKLTEYVKNNIRQQFNTVGKERTVTTVGCGTFTVSGGIYGFVVDVSDEVEQLAQDILSGGKVEREPIYSQEETYTANGGLGSTYIDVSISKQHVWLVRNGDVIVSTPCVTGNVNNGTITPKGMYWIEFKRRNYDMPRYNVSVNYWMPIDTSTGVGLHDATWRNTFGGSYYISTGSHGCINLPVDAARTIFNNCFGTMPVVVH